MTIVWHNLHPDSLTQKICTFIFTLLFTFGTCTASRAQSNALDSLRTLLNASTTADTVRVKLLVNIANTVVWNDANESMTYADEALELSRRLGWQKGIAGSLRQKGVSYYHLSDFLKALDMFHEALTASEGLPDKNIIPSIYNNIANIYAELRQYNRALESYKQFLKSSEEVGQKAYQVIALTNIGVLYNDLNQPDNSIEYLRKAMDLAKELNSTNFIPAILNNLAMAYDEKNDFDKAIHFYREAVATAKTTGNKNAQSSALNSISIIQLKADNNAEAEMNSQLALELATEVNSLERQADVWRTLTDVYEKKGDYNQALKAYRNHISLRDSILSEENKAEITRKEMQFQMDKNEAVAAVELKRERLIRNISILGGVILLLGSLLSYWSYKKRRDALARQQEADFKTQVAETELKALLSQMNPHFIFNSLNSISDYISKHDTEKANHYLVKFSNLIRMILESSEKRAISLEDELQLIETYLQIESMRLNHKFIYEIKVDPAVDTANTLIPPLILQPFIENSIWHGISKKADTGKISLEIRRDNNSIIYSVEDDGVGRRNAPGENNENKNPMGTKISRSRINIINRLKGTNGDIKLIDQPQGLRVEVKLPLELAF